MKGLYLLSLIAVITVTASAVETTLKPCVIVPGCPTKNDADNTVHVAYQLDCHKFYKCNARCGYLMDCPLIPGSTERLVFNPSIQVCDWPSNVPDVMCPVINCDIPRVCPATGSKKIANEKNCHAFYQCTNGEKKFVECAEGTFNPETESCNENAECYITAGCDP